MAYRPRVLQVDEGGTGSTTPGGARTNLGLLGAVNIIVFSTSGTYTPSPGMQFCIVEVLGGGGGAGGSAAGTATTEAFGAGGASGEYASGYFTASTIGSSQTITIGTAGSGGVGSAAGTGGGNTSFGSLITCFGGTGGAGGTSSTNGLVGGGTGGTGGSGGPIRSKGASGGIAFWATSFVPLNWCGAGAVSYYNGGTRSNSFTGPINANGIGDGGGGGVSPLSSPQTTGGNGTVGRVIITEYTN